MGELNKDKRIEFIREYTLTSMRLKIDKWNKIIISDEQRQYLLSFIDNQEPQTLVISQNIAGHLQVCNLFAFCFKTNQLFSDSHWLAKSNEKQRCLLCQEGKEAHSSRKLWLCWTPGCRWCLSQCFRWAEFIKNILDLHLMLQIIFALGLKKLLFQCLIIQKMSRSFQPALLQVKFSSRFIFFGFGTVKNEFSLFQISRSRFTSWPQQCIRSEVTWEVWHCFPFLRELETLMRKRGESMNPKERLWTPSWRTTLKLLYPNGLIK